MQITAVKFQGKGYLMNGTISVPKADDNRHYQAVQEWILDGNIPEPEFTQKELLDQEKEKYSGVIQAELDNKARSLGYDSIFTAVTYADEPGVAKFQAEGQALRKWRSLAWEYAYDMLGQVEQGIINTPAIEDFIAGMPSYE